MSVGRQQALTQTNSYTSFLIMVKRAQEKVHQHIYDTSGCYQASRLAKKRRNGRKSNLNYIRFYIYRYKKLNKY